MEKRLLVCLILASFIFSLFSVLVSASSIDSEIQKLTNYAQDYETGNINYIQLLIYSSAVRGKMNEVLGATDKEMGGVLKQEQLQQILGEPTEKTRWVWVENEQKEEKMQDDIPAWRKIVFDGNKIQLWLSAWPNIIYKKDEKVLFYRLNIEVQFKKPGEQLDILSRISEIKTLAENYNANPSMENAEILAQKSVSAERAFESYLRQNQGKCEDIMASVFGSENKRESQKMLVQEIEFYEGDNFVAIIRLEMCEECEWHWINLNVWFEGRGPGFKPPKENSEMVSQNQFKNLDSSSFKTEISNIIQELKSALEQGDYGKVFSVQPKLNAINEAWNQKSNDVWQEADKIFEEKRKSMNQQEQEEYNKNYRWIKDEQEKRQMVQETASQNYRERKEFYLSLFSEYEKKEIYFTQEEYEKRLVEEFMEFGEEICDNNVDDNKNEEIDCADSQCSGKICGKQNVKRTDIDGNETAETDVLQNLYCIVGTCQLKEEIIEEKPVVCGNHICDGNETTENCAEDCSLCETYGAVNCSGRVIFKGKNGKGCPLEPICIEETTFCEKDEDCFQTLCGSVKCIENECKTEELTECREPECSEGQEKVKNCENGDEIIFEKCLDSFWINTGADCPQILVAEENITFEEVIIEGPVNGNDCMVKEDCGNPDDVCSNGRCVTIPKAIRVAPAEQVEIREMQEPMQQQEKIETPAETSGETQTEAPVEQPQPEQPLQEEVVQTEQQPQEEIQEEPPQEPAQEQTAVTGQVIRTFKTIARSITGFVISLTGFDVDGTSEAPAPEPAPEPQPAEEQPQPEPQQEQQQEETPEQQYPPEGQPTQPEQPFQENQQPQQYPEEYHEEYREDDGNWEEDNRREEQDRRNQECSENCERNCKDSLIMPCVEKCSREAECNDNSCIDETIKTCEDKCKQEKDFERCVSDCSDKCLRGEQTQIAREEEKPKMEKAVFKAGGTCRKSASTTEGFIFFDGWGEPFEELRMYKQKYYSGGNADWCKEDLDNLIKQRKEFENSFNEEFVRWFFEKYLANSAEDWEQHVSGIFELYWKDVENSKQITERLNCLEKTELPEHSLINIKYETEFGKLEFWEEVKTTKLPGIDKEMQIISPYMKIWIFPPKEFIIYELKQAMKNHEFPGKDEDKLERKNEEGPTAEEKEKIKQDRGFMKKLSEISGKYNGKLRAEIKFVDYEKNIVVFDLYAQVNEQDILKVVPMLPEEIQEKDVEVEMDFQQLYDMIYASEKEMQGERIETPFWERQVRPVAKVKEIVNGAKMYLKVRSMLNSAKITPEESKKDVTSLMKEFFSMMMKSEKGKGMGEGGGEMGESDEENKALEDKMQISADVIKSYNSA